MIHELYTHDNTGQIEMSEELGNKEPNHCVIGFKDDDGWINAGIKTFLNIEDHWELDGFQNKNILNAVRKDWSEIYKSHKKKELKEELVEELDSLKETLTILKKKIHQVQLEDVNNVYDKINKIKKEIKDIEKEIESIGNIKDIYISYQSKKKTKKGEWVDCTRKVRVTRKMFNSYKEFRKLFFKNGYNKEDWSSITQIEFTGAKGDCIKEKIGDEGYAGGMLYADSLGCNDRMLFEEGIIAGSKIGIHQEITQCKISACKDIFKLKNRLPNWSLSQIERFIDLVTELRLSDDAINGLLFRNIEYKKVWSESDGHIRIIKVDKSLTKSKLDPEKELFKLRKIVDGVGEEVVDRNICYYSTTHENMLYSEIFSAYFGQKKRTLDYDDLEYDDYFANQLAEHETETRYAVDTEKYFLNPEDEITWFEKQPKEFKQLYRYLLKVDMIEVNRIADIINKYKKTDKKLNFKLNSLQGSKVWTLINRRRVKHLKGKSTPKFIKLYDSLANDTDPIDKVRLARIEKAIKGLKKQASKVEYKLLWMAYNVQEKRYKKENK